jgi:hypothetical protein
MGKKKEKEKLLSNGTERRGVKTKKEKLSLFLHHDLTIINGG